MFFAILFLSPAALIVAILLGAPAHDRGPKGIPYLLWVLLLFAWIMGALATYMTIDLMVLDGAQAQRRLLGRQYAGVFQLRYHEVSELPDPGQEWRYRLDPATIAELRPKCREEKGAPGRCVLYRYFDSGLDISVTLEGDELIVGDWTW